MKSKLFLIIACVLAVVLVLTACGEESSSEGASESASGTSSAASGEDVSADEAIEKVRTICYVAADGPKVKAIVVEYNKELNADSVSLDTYDVTSYANLPQVFDVAKDNGGPTEGEEADQPYSTYPEFAEENGTPGAPVKVYVSEKPEIDENGTGDKSGNYVVIELNTDYMLTEACSDWRASIAGGVVQKEDIVAEDCTITASEETHGNYEPGYFYDISPFGSNHSETIQKVFDDTSYVLEGISDYKIYTNDTTPSYTAEAENGVETLYPDATILSMVAGPAFTAKDCFSEYDGETYDTVDLMYSLYVPDDYEDQVAEGKKFALAIQMTDAGGLGDDPVTTLTECQAASNYASDAVQQVVKDQGLGGLIVVVPQIPKSGQTMADNLTGNEYVPATWQLLDYLTETYEIDMDRIYGSGQSMGGMQLLDMAAQRDNYFAAIWSIGSQWGNNYDKSAEYQGASYYTYPVDGKMITNEDWQNWYYAISDDNILVTNMTGDESSTSYWEITKDFYSDLAGVEIPYTEWDPLSESAEEQDQLLKDLTSQENQTGIYWNALTNGSHRSTWVYAHAISYSYEWLLSQTRQDEVDRGKLDVLNEVYPAGTKDYNTPIGGDDEGGNFGGGGEGGDFGGGEGDDFGGGEGEDFGGGEGGNFQEGESGD